MSLELRKRLRSIQKRPENRHCADCPAKNPSWASINLGVFLCLNCAGIHRDMGVHISQVRSVDLDTWKNEWVDVMDSWGNRRGNFLYEGSLTETRKLLDGIKPTEQDSLNLTQKLKTYIRGKYQHEKWIHPKGKQYVLSHDFSNPTETQPLPKHTVTKTAPINLPKQPAADDLFDLLDISETLPIDTTPKNKPISSGPSTHEDKVKDIMSFFTSEVAPVKSHSFSAIDTPVIKSSPVTVDPFADLLNIN